MHNYVDLEEDEFAFNTNKKIVNERVSKIENYDEITNKNQFLNNKISISLAKLENENIYLDRKNIEDFKRNSSYKIMNQKEIFNYKNRENFTKDKYFSLNKIEKIIEESSRIENLIYSKINMLDFSNFNKNFYEKNISNLLSIKKLSKFKKLSRQNLLSKIYYEYNKLNEKISFYSNFEMGNLSFVYKNINKKNEYDLIISSDKNVDLSTGWFYFKIVGASKGDKIKINIVNLVRTKSLNERKKIAIKSVKLNENKTETILNNWKYAGENIHFKKNENSNFYNLSFEFTFKYNDEIVYIAENVPYSTTRIENYLNKIFENNNISSNLFFNKNNKKKYVL